MEETYIYDNIEVKKTGRTATRKASASGKVDVLFEITPVNPLSGNWKKWVRNAEMFTIENNKQG